MEIIELVKNKKKSFCILIGLLIFFLGMLAAYGVGVYNDSDQYITMHIHREPLYPLFLAFFRAFLRYSDKMHVIYRSISLFPHKSQFFYLHFIRI